MTKFFYRVQKGDTVSSLSQRFSIPQIKIISLNGLKAEITEGDMLYLEKENAKTYRVGLFDTLESIAQKFGISEEKLLEINGVEYIFYGQTIIVGK